MLQNMVLCIPINNVIDFTTGADNTIYKGCDLNKILNMQDEEWTSGCDWMVTDDAPEL